jgi:DNA-binding transcriptional regulator YiaG
MMRTSKVFIPVRSAGTDSTASDANFWRKQMSRKLSLREALAQREKAPASVPTKSGSRVRVALKADGAISRPVDLARLLMSHGLSLRKAHETLNKITAGETAFIELFVDKKKNIATMFQLLEVTARVLTKPDVDIRAVRNRLGLSQTEFALRFGFELDTIQNWEQGRYKPDTAALLLLKIIATRPEIVDAALEESQT